jgi:prepilin-type N-terminal cleavage/methylation domain-containing protein
MGEMRGQIHEMGFSIIEILITLAVVGVIIVVVTWFIGGV